MPWIDRFPSARRNPGFEVSVKPGLAHKEAVVRAGIRPTELREYKKRHGGHEMRDYVKLSFHDCRHAWASWCLSNGQAPANVQKWGGWEDAKTMAIYDHFIPSGFEVDQLKRSSGAGRKQIDLVGRCRQNECFGFSPRLQPEASSLTRRGCGPIIFQGEQRGWLGSRKEPIG